MIYVIPLIFLLALLWFLFLINRVSKAAECERGSPFASKLISEFENADWKYHIVRSGDEETITIVEGPLARTIIFHQETESYILTDCVSHTFDVFKRDGFIFTAVYSSRTFNNYDSKRLYETFERLFDEEEAKIFNS